MFKENQKVKCKETGLIGKVLEKEWENGWRYTLTRENGSFFYRDEHLLSDYEEKYLCSICEKTYKEINEAIECCTSEYK